MSHDNLSLSLSLCCSVSFSWILYSSRLHDSQTTFPPPLPYHHTINSTCAWEFWPCTSSALPPLVPILSEGSWADDWDDPEGWESPEMPHCCCQFLFLFLWVFRVFIIQDRKEQTGNVWERQIGVELGNWPRTDLNLGPYGQRVCTVHGVH